MDPFTFANQVAAAKDKEPELDRWAHQYLENSALQTLRAARYVEHAHAHIVRDYRNVLKTTLERLPKEVEIEVSVDLFETLLRISGAEMSALLQSKVHTAVGCS